MPPLLQPGDAGCSVTPANLLIAALAGCRTLSWSRGSPACSPLSHLQPTPEETLSLLYPPHYAWLGNKGEAALKTSPGDKEIGPALLSAVLYKGGLG